MCTICNLITQAKQRNSDSMLELCDVFSPLIKKYAYKLNYEDAQSDLIVNMIQLIYDMPSFSNDGQAVSYIKQSVHHFYIKYVKEQISIRENESLYDPEIIRNMECLSEDFTEPYIDLYKAISQLSGKQRYIIIYKFKYMLADKDIMCKLNISRQSVYENKIKALNKLRKLLKESV